MSADDGNGTLRDGMTIVGTIRARLLGFELLRLNADVAIAPLSERRRARQQQLEAPPARARQQQIEAPRTRRSLPATNGTVGGSLEEAAKALEATSGELLSSRRRLP